MVSSHSLPSKIYLFVFVEGLKEALGEESIQRSVCKLVAATGHI